MCSDTSTQRFSGYEFPPILFITLWSVGNKWNSFSLCLLTLQRDVRLQVLLLSGVHESWLITVCPDCEIYNFGGEERCHFALEGSSIFLLSKYAVQIMALDPAVFQSSVCILGRLDLCSLNIFQNRGSSSILFYSHLIWDLRHYSAWERPVIFSIRFNPSVTMYNVDISQLLVNLKLLMKIMLEGFSLKLWQLLIVE